MNLVPEKFKLVSATYKGNEFMKIQYEDKDLVMKLKGEFQIHETKTFGLRLLFTPDDKTILDKIHELAGYKNESKNNCISLSMNKNIPMDQNKCRSKPNALKKIKMRGCVAVCFSSFSLFLDRLNAYAQQVKVNEFLEEEEIESLFDEED